MSWLKHYTLKSKYATFVKQIDSLLLPAKCFLTTCAQLYHNVCDGWVLLETGRNTAPPCRVPHHVTEPRYARWTRARVPLLRRRCARCRCGVNNRALSLSPARALAAAAASYLLGFLLTDFYSPCPFPKAAGLWIQCILTTLNYRLLGTRLHTKLI